MNERIRELVRQAIIEVDVVYEDNPLNEELEKMYIPDCFSEKFAELIVRECSAIVQNAVNYREPASTYVGKIKEHFGVEE